MGREIMALQMSLLSQTWFRRSLVAVFSLAGALLIATGLIGFAHTAAGRQSAVGRYILTKLVMACPVQSLSAEAAGKLREVGVAQLRGSRAAPSREPGAINQAMRDFKFDQTSLATARDVLNASGIQCHEKKTGFTILKCVPAENQELNLAFGPGERLISVEMYATKLTLVAAAELFQQRSRDLKRSLGAPSSASAAKRVKSSLAEEFGGSYVRYRFSDYLVDLVTIHLPDGISVREESSSATPTQRGLVTR
jgi:hypothetical protein